MTSSDALVEIQQVTRRFGSVVALDNVTLQIHTNEFFALLGPSGWERQPCSALLPDLRCPTQARSSLAGKT